MNPVSPHQFSIFRMALGVYLFIHFASLIPYGPEMFSSEGLIPDGSWNPTSKIFPNILIFYDAPMFTQMFLVVLTILSGLLIIGWKRPWVSILLWYGWACMFNRNIFTGNPGLAFLGWALLALVVIPTGEPLAKGCEKDPDWTFPKEIFYGAWVLMALGYTLSGIHKLGSPSWVDGSALSHVLANPLARNNPLCTWMITQPILLKMLTWGALGLEIGFAPLALFPKLRPWVWLAMVGMHLGILGVIDFADLTIGVLMFHLFTFDARWIPARTHFKHQVPILFFDGVCGFCNGFIDFLLQEDKHRIYQFSPLQGDAAKQFLDEAHRSQLDNLALWDNKVTLIKSSAVLKCLSDIGGLWGLSRIFYLVPSSLRDFVYDLIARNRYHYFGKRGTCRFPTPEERTRFLQ
ncbi:MAG: DCC1-like thiol-disulfide oxidoreductase family protein [Nitrospinota bacterium]|nr:DCC1-like thiol-disulfide oxidoreductase family protein [Nitrospinota bacterium]